MFLVTLFNLQGACCLICLQRKGQSGPGCLGQVAPAGRTGHGGGQLRAYPPFFPAPLLYSAGRRPAGFIFFINFEKIFWCKNLLCLSWSQRCYPRGRVRPRGPCEGGRETTKAAQGITIPTPLTSAHTTPTAKIPIDKRPGIQYNGIWAQ